MGCRCNNNHVIEGEIEFRTECNISNNKELNNENVNNNMSDLITNDKKRIKIEEIDTTIIGYPELALNLINKIRKNPKDYADVIEDSIKNIDQEKYLKNPKVSKLIYKGKINVALVRGEPAFREAAEELRNMEPVEPLKFRKANCLTLPDDIEDYDNSKYLIDKVKEKMKDNIHINVFYKERVGDPEISVLLMIVDDRNKMDTGKKRKALLNSEFKYIGITSKYIDDVFISYYSFSKE